MGLTCGRAGLADGEGGARVAPVAGDPRNEVAEHEVAVLDDAAARRAADLRRAQTGHKVGQHGQSGARGALHLASDGRPQLELRDSRLGVGASRPLACVADGDRRADQLDLVRVLDCARRSPARRRRRPSRARAASATGSVPASIATRAAVEHLGQRSRCRADRIERADPEARVGHDLTARRHRSFGLVVADDEDRSPAEPRTAIGGSANGLGPDSISGTCPVSHVTTHGCATRSVPAPAVSAIVIALWRRGSIRTSPSARRRPSGPVPSCRCSARCRATRRAVRSRPASRSGGSESSRI